MKSHVYGTIPNVYPFRRGALHTSEFLRLVEGKRAVRAYKRRKAQGDQRAEGNAEKSDGTECESRATTSRQSSKQRENRK